MFHLYTQDCSWCMRVQFNFACWAPCEQDRLGVSKGEPELGVLLSLLLPFLYSICPPGPVPSFQILNERTIVVPCRALAYLCSTSCCQAAGEAKKQNLQAPHGECLPLGGLLSTSPVFMGLEPRSCARIPCIHRHTDVG